MEPIQKFDDPKVLKAKLQEILVEGPLYRNFTYTGAECHFIDKRPPPGRPRPRYGELPKQLRMHCSHAKCKAPMLWDASDVNVSFSSSDFIRHRYYTCRGCGVTRQFYDFIWQENEDSNVFVKVGQYPPVSIQPSAKLEKALGPDDTELYKKGLIEFNFGHGLGAVAYFRRVLENKINALLDLVAEAAQNENAAGDLVATIATAKANHRVEDRIAIASKILPAHLKPGGHNPFDKLYAPLSAGLHGESDDQCLTTFSEAKFVFEYLFKNLTESNEEARRYVKQLSAQKAADTQKP